MEDLRHRSLPSNLSVIRGSNTEAEFSAYEEGIDSLRSGGDLPEVLLIANDRVLSYGDRYQGVLTPRVLATVCKYRLLCGSVESYHRPITAFGCNLGTWCRSNFMLLSRETLGAVGSLVSVTRQEFDRAVPTVFPGRDWAPSDWLGPEHAGIIIDWLTRPGNWYLAEPITEGYWDTLRLKILAIANEQRFSLRARQAAVRLVGYKQLLTLSAVRSHPRLSDRMLNQYATHPFMGDDRQRSPALRLLQMLVVWSAALGLERGGRWALDRALLQHERDCGRVPSPRALRLPKAGAENSEPR
jgi:hypothetical protein